MSKEQKSTLHNLLDPYWHLIIPISHKIGIEGEREMEKQRQNFRSVIYRFLATVLYGWKKDFDESGFLDPLQGKHHISYLSEELFPIYVQILTYVFTHENKKGSVNFISQRLVS